MSGRQLKMSGRAQKFLAITALWFANLELSLFRGWEVVLYWSQGKCQCIDICEMAAGWPNSLTEPGMDLAWIWFFFQIKSSNIQIQIQIKSTLLQMPQIQIRIHWTKSGFKSDSNQIRIWICTPRVLTYTRNSKRKYTHCYPVSTQNIGWVEAITG